MIVRNGFTGTSDTAIVNSVEAVAAAASVAVAVTAKVPASVGVPETSPELLTETPAGSPVAVQV